MLKSKPNLPANAGWEKDLAAAGFAARTESNGYSLNGITLRVGDRWSSLESDAPGRIADPLIRQMGKPALWKCVKMPAGPVRRLFEFPLSLAADATPGTDDEFEQPVSALQTLLVWALATLDGQRLDGWRPPAYQQVQALIPAKAMTVLCDTDARQGELVCKSQRLALRFPILPGIPDGLGEDRLYWLRRLLLEAQNRWKLVRMGFSRDPVNTAALAEVDLTGAPPGVLPDLVKVALAALRGAVAWTVPAAAFLIDGAVDSSTLASGRDLRERHISKFDPEGGDENE